MLCHKTESVAQYVMFPYSGLQEDKERDGVKELIGTTAGSRLGCLTQGQKQAKQDAQTSYSFQGNA